MSVRTIKRNSNYEGIQTEKVLLFRGVPGRLKVESSPVGVCFWVPFFWGGEPAGHLPLHTRMQPPVLGGMD